MNLLVHGRFYPSIGGIETVLQLLATEWQRAGEHVIVVSDVACPRSARRDFPFDVEYRPRPLQWGRLIRWADLFVHMNLSLKALWPRLLAPVSPFVVTHQGFYYSDSIHGRRNWRERLKVRLLPGAINIAVSRSIAARLPVSSDVIPNPFDDSTFHLGGRGDSERDLIFVGRLVSEKGAGLLLRAVERLRERELQPTLTFVGDGPEREWLRNRVQSLGMGNQISFAGACSSHQVANLLRRHEVLIVPSESEEPFGVVALEGAACGCVVLGSDGGGLPEAIGPAGLTYKRGDLADLSSKLAYLLLHPEQRAMYRQLAPAHLKRHRAALVANRYLSFFRGIVQVDRGHLARTGATEQ